MKSRKRAVARGSVLAGLALAAAISACGSSSSLVGDPGDRAGPVPLTGDAASFADVSSPVLLAAALRYPPPSKDLEPLLSLTASDGTGLRLQSFDARAYVDGPLAFTETRLVFENPEDRVLEGRFSITLPPGAAISRLAMRIDERFQEAEVVELQAARRAYEDFLHRRQDPLLLEKEAGNVFSARVFPIPARGVKEIIVSYSQEIEGASPYRLQVVGLPEVKRFHASVRSSDGAAFAVEETGYRPTRDIEVPIASRARGLRSGRYALARVSPELESQPVPVKGMTVLFDTSASRALGFAGEVEAFGALVDELEEIHGPELALTVAAFDQGVMPVFRGPISRFAAGDRERLLARRPLGASDVGQALSWVAENAPAERVVIVTDGMVTAGAGQGEDLDRAVEALRSTTTRLDVIARGGVRDDEVLGRLARGRLSRDGVVLQGILTPAELARRLSQTTVSDVRVAVPGAEWVWPESLSGLQPGDEVMVYAGFSGAGGAPKSVKVQLSGPVQQTSTLDLAPAQEKLLERAAVRAEIARLTQERLDLAQAQTAERDRLRERIIDLSTRYRVLSDFTGLLVLETEDDYRRFGIERTALADILTVGPKGLAIVSRDRPVVLSVADEGGETDEQRPETKQKVAEIGAELSELSKATLGGRPDDDGPPEDAKPDNDADGIADKFDLMPMEEAEEAAAGRPRAMRPPSAAPAPPPPPPPPGADPSAPSIGAFGPNDATLRVRPGPVAAESPRAEAAQEERAQAPEPTGPPPLAGRFAAIAERIAKGNREQAVVDALTWQNEEPGDVMALVALGESLEAIGQPLLAARCYGSVLDLFPARADLRRFAASRLERLPGALGLAVDAYRRAVDLRPDHLTGHRALAYSLLRGGRLPEAFEALEKGLQQSYPEGRFREGDRVLREDLGLVGAAWLAREPARRSEVQRRLAAAGARIEDEPSLRFVLSWETDANDVDFHIYDADGGHAFFSNPTLPSGGELYADVTTGYGPECFNIPGGGKAGPYRVRLHYYSRGPMGYGMGKLEVVRHDGRGGIALEERPFVVMNDGAYVDIGEIAASAGKVTALQVAR